MYDLAIIGAGPAGMSAAVYALRAGLSVAVFEGASCGGQMINTPEIANYPGVENVNGAELSNAMRTQMLSLGAELIERTVLSVTDENGFTIKTKKNEYSSRALIIANGAKRRNIGVEGETRLAHRGVSYCAVCDGMFFKGRDVAVVGGGNTALEDALYLSKICNRVYLIHRRDSFRAQQTLVKRVDEAENIELVMNSAVGEIMGDERVEKILVKSGENEKILPVSAVFVAIGLAPDNGIFENIVELDTQGYVRAGADTHTSHKGVFAAGDTRTTDLRQIVTAAADGAIAATEAEKFIRG